MWNIGWWAQNCYSLLTSKPDILNPKSWTQSAAILPADPGVRRVSNVCRSMTVQPCRSVILGEGD